MLAKGDARVDAMIPVTLQIDMHQTDADGDEATLALYTDGRYVYEGDTHVLEYDESSLVGQSGTTRMTLSQGQVFLTRGSDPDAQLFFQAGQQNQNRLTTPSGTVQLDVFPVSVDYGINECGGEVHLVYQISAEGRQVGLNRLHLRFKKEGIPACL